MARQNIEQELRNLTFSDGDDFQNHITIMRNKLSQARALGADITDKNFKTILLNSLPSSWDPVAASLYKDIPISETISQLQVWWLRISRNRPINSPRSITALQTNTYNPRDYPQVVCANPNCRRRSHTIEVCYWPGGGKEGQFPPGFGQRRGARGTGINTRQGGYRPRPTANTAIAKDPEEREVFALMTMDDTEFEVTTSPPLSDPSPPNKPVTNSYNATGLLGHEIRGARVVSENSNRLHDTCNNDSKSQFNVPTLIDSRASDHCFVNRESFISLTPLHQPTMGLAAAKESIFNVTGKGKAKIETCVNGTNRNITFEDALHTPELRSNLISVSKLAEKGVKVEFDQHEARVRSVSGAIIMTAKRCGRLYAIETISRTPTALVSQTKR